MALLETAEELAVRLRVSPRTVRDWARRGLIPRIKVSGKVVRFDVEAVIATLRNQNDRNHD